MWSISVQEWILLVLDAELRREILFPPLETSTGSMSIGIHESKVSVKSDRIYPVGCHIDNDRPQYLRDDQHISIRLHFRLSVGHHSVCKVLSRPMSRTSLGK